eukprot:GHVH01006822.1.p1 GENE.GHVH01006822.1~~GHVH01006822.1.p1  ORF type:complete len:689 (+),score=93.77 GHVH01006822.1:2191-4257(+)
MPSISPGRQRGGASVLNDEVSLLCREAAEARRRALRKAEKAEALSSWANELERSLRDTSTYGEAVGYDDDRGYLRMDDQGDASARWSDDDSSSQFSLRTELAQARTDYLSKYLSAKGVPSATVHPTHWSHRPRSRQEGNSQRFSVADVQSRSAIQYRRSLNTMPYIQPNRAQYPEQQTQPPPSLQPPLMTQQSSLSADNYSLNFLPVKSREFLSDNIQYHNIATDRRNTIQQNELQCQYTNPPDPPMSSSAIADVIPAVRREGFRGRFPGSKPTAVTTNPFESIQDANARSIEKLKSADDSTQEQTLDSSMLEHGQAQQTLDSSMLEHGQAQQTLDSSMLEHGHDGVIRIKNETAVLEKLLSMNPRMRHINGGEDLLLRAYETHLNGSKQAAPRAVAGRKYPESCSAPATIQEEEEEEEEEDEEKEQEQEQERERVSTAIRDDLHGERPTKSSTEGDDLELHPNFKQTMNKTIRVLEINCKAFDSGDATSRRLKVIQAYADPNVMIIQELLTRDESTMLLDHLARTEWKKDSTDEYEMSRLGQSDSRTISSVLGDWGRTWEQRLKCAYSITASTLIGVTLLKQCKTIPRTFFQDQVTHYRDRSWLISHICLIFLNNDFEGGREEFTDLGFKLRPQIGLSACWPVVDSHGVRVDVVNMPLRKTAKISAVFYFGDSMDGSTQRSGVEVGS